MTHPALVEAGLLIGYARVSTDEQDLTAQIDALVRLGVSSDRIYSDHGRTGTNRDRQGLREAMAACRSGDTLVVPKLDRLARSVRDAADIASELEARGVRLSLGGTVYDPSDPISKMFFGLLALFAEFEADLIRARTREGMAVAKANGRLKGGKPKLTPAQERHVVDLWDRGEHSAAEIGALVGVGRSTVYRIVERRASPLPGAHG